MDPHNRLAAWSASLPLTDQQAAFYPAEAEALRTWFTEHLPLTTSPLFTQPVGWQNVDRLIEPIQRALLHCGHDQAGIKPMLACYHHLLWEMHARQVSFWAWDEAVWLDIIGLTKQAFVLNRGLDHLRHVTRPALRAHLMSCAYLLGGIPIYDLVDKCQPVVVANQIFGDDAIRAALCSVQTELQRHGWSSAAGHMAALPSCISKALLFNRSPHLENLTFNSLEEVYHRSFPFPSLKRGFVVFSRALHLLGIIPQPLAAHSRRKVVRLGQQDNVPAVWQELLNRWSAATSGSKAIRSQVKVAVAKAARWSALLPESPGPSQWTQLTALQFGTAVKDMTKGKWVHPDLALRYKKADQPMKPASKAQLLNCLRRFFADCQEWNWIPRLFNPTRYLATPSSIKTLCGIKPRVINQEAWKKLLQASFALTPEDLTSHSGSIQL